MPEYAAWHRKFYTPMKTILHVIDSNEPGGAETIFVELADRLRRKGYRSLAVVPGNGWAYQELLRRGISPIVMGARGSFNLKLLRELIQLIRRERVSVIQSHLLGSNVYCGLAGFLTNTPVVATFHGMVDISPTERFRKLKFMAMELGVKAYVAVSKRLQDEIDKKGLLNLTKTHVIYNGIDTSRYGKSSAKDLRQQLGLDSNATLIGSLGNLHPAKGYDYLVRAAQNITNEHPNAHFVIAGEAKSGLMEELNQLTKSVGVSGNVHFIGFVTDSAKFLSQLDIFLLPSVSEGFSIVTLEALAAGLPAVITRCGGPEEIVGDDRSAILIEAQNEAAIAQALTEVLGNPECRFQLTQDAVLTVKRFSLESTIDAYVTLYESQDY